MHCNAGVLKCTGAPDSQSGVLSILCFTVQYDDFLQEKPICVIGKWGSLVSQLEPLSRLGFFFLFFPRVERGCLSSRQPRKTARSPVLLLVLAVFFLVWIRGGKQVRIGMPGFLISNTATDDSPLPRKKIPFEHQIEHEVKAHGQKGEVVPGAQQDGKSQDGQGQQARRGQSCGHPRRCGGLHPGAQ